MSCFWGGHTWKMRIRFDCKAYRGNMFGKIRHNIPAEIEFSKCEKCGAISCLLTDGDESKIMNAGFEARKIIKKNPDLANDPFMKEVAER